MTSVGSEIRHRGETFEDGQADELAGCLADDQILSEFVRPLVGPFYVLIFLSSENGDRGLAHGAQGAGK